MAVAAVDATGAGDCFAGALCHYLQTGLELAAAVRLAVAAAALSTRALGAQERPAHRRRSRPRFYASGGVT